MSAEAMNARRPVLKWAGMLAALISLAAGLGSTVPAPQAAADAVPSAIWSGSSAESARPITAYVVNQDSATVTPISTATNTAGPPITVGGCPTQVAITPDGVTAYVVNLALGNQFLGAVTPIATATNTAGPPIAVGSSSEAIAITPATGTQGPAFTSGSAATATFGAAFTFTITATGGPGPQDDQNRSAALRSEIR
jgi:hypothetical protein